MLDASAYNLVPPKEISACAACGGGYMPDRQFVSFDNLGAGEEDVAGVIETHDDGAGLHAYRVRDGGGTQTIVVRKLQLCSDCLGRGAELIGLGDTAPLHAMADELNRQLLEQRQAFDESERHRIEAEAALRETAVYQRLLAAGDTPKAPPAKPRAGKAG